MYLKHKQNRQEQINKKNEENDTTQRAKFVTKFLNRLWKNSAFIIKEKTKHSYNQLGSSKRTNK